MAYVIDSKTAKAPEELEYFADCFSDFDQERRKREPAWNRWNAMWRGVFHEDKVESKTDGTMPPQPATAHKSKLYINQTKQAIVSAVANIMTVMFQQYPPFDVKGRITDIEDTISKDVGDMVWYYLSHSDFVRKCKRYLTNCAIYGTSYGKVYMDMMRDVSLHVMDKLNPITLEKMGSERIERINEWPVVCFDDIDIFDIWHDPEAISIKKYGRGIFHRVWRSTEIVKARMRNKTYRDIMDKLGLDDKGSSVGQLQSQRDRRRAIEGLEALRRKQCALLEFWGVMPSAEAGPLGIQTVGSEDETPVHCVFLAGQDGYQIQDYLLAERNSIPGQMLPFVVDVWEDLGSGFDGRGIPENVQGPQTALNVTINSRIDNKAAAIQQILGVNTEELDDPDEDLQFKQNWVIRTKIDPNHVIKALSVPDLTANSYQESQFFSTAIEEQSSVTKFVQGTESFGSNRTASGIQTVYQAANKYLQDLTSQFEQNLIARTCMLVYQHVLKFMPDEILVKVTRDPMAPEYRKMVIGDLAEDLEFVPSGVHGLAVKAQQQGNLIQFAQVMKDSPYVNQPELIKKVYESFGFKDAEKILNPNPVLPIPGQNPQAQGANQGSVPAVPPQNPIAG